MKKTRFNNLAKENLVDDAVTANANDGSANPTDALKAVDFDQEIQALKNSQLPEAGTPDAGGVDFGSGGSDDTSTSDDDSNLLDGDLGGDDDFDLDADPDSGDDEDGDDDEFSSDDIDAMDAEEEVASDAEVANEAFVSLAIERYFGIVTTFAQARETGYVSKESIALMNKATNRVAKDLNISEPIGFATEAFSASNVWDRVRKMIAKIIAFVTDMYKNSRDWLVSFAKAYWASQGKYTKDVAGYKLRLKALKQQKTIEAGTVKVALPTAIKDNLETMDALREGVVDFIGMSGAIVKRFNGAPQRFSTLADSLMNEMGTNGVVSGAGTMGVDFDALFLSSSVSSAFTQGSSRIQSRTTKGNSQDTKLLMLSGVLGHMDLKWVFPDNAITSLEKRVAANNSSAFYVTPGKKQEEAEINATVENAEFLINLFEQSSGLSEVLMEALKRITEEGAQAKSKLDKLNDALHAAEGNAAQRDDIQIQIVLNITLAMSSFRAYEALVLSPLRALSKINRLVSSQLAAATGAVVMSFDKQGAKQPVATA